MAKKVMFPSLYPVKEAPDDEANIPGATLEEERARNEELNKLKLAARGRVSLLLYLGAGLIALSGLLSVSAIAYLHDGRLPPSFTDYSGAIIIVGIAFVLVGFARQAKRMCE